MLFPLKLLEFSQNEARERENCLLKLNCAFRKVSSLFKSEKPAKSIFNEKFKSRQLLKNYITVGLGYYGTSTFHSRYESQK